VRHRLIKNIDFVCVCVYCFWSTFRFLKYIYIGTTARQALRSTRAARAATIALLTRAATMFARRATTVLRTWLLVSLLSCFFAR
jgi:hypothetical protein